MLGLSCEFDIAFCQVERLRSFLVVAKSLTGDSVSAWFVSAFFLSVRLISLIVEDKVVWQFYLKC